MRSWFTLAIVLAVLVLEGCATPALRNLPEVTPTERSRAAALDVFQVNGRVAVKYDGQGFSGNFRWQHSATTDNVLLLSPLGQGVAQLMQDASGVVLTTAEQREYRAQDPADLTEQVLGWRLPLNNLRYWVRGVAVPNGGGSTVQGEDQRLAQLSQDGWRIDYLSYRAVDGIGLPAKLRLQSGDLEIKLLLDEWTLPTTPQLP
jgi:outer membrane lipoprotein LolB